MRGFRLCGPQDRSARPTGGFHGARSVARSRKLAPRRDISVRRGARACGPCRLGRERPGRALRSDLLRQAPHRQGGRDFRRKCDEALDHEIALQTGLLQGYEGPGPHRPSPRRHTAVTFRWMHENSPPDLQSRNQPQVLALRCSCGKCRDGWSCATPCSRNGARELSTSTVPASRETSINLIYLAASATASSAAAGLHATVRKLECIPKRIIVTLRQGRDRRALRTAVMQGAPDKI